MEKSPGENKEAPNKSEQFPQRKLSDEEVKRGLGSAAIKGVNGGKK